MALQPDWSASPAPEPLVPMRCTLWRTAGPPAHGRRRLRPPKGLGQLSYTILQGAPARRSPHRVPRFRTVSFVDPNVFETANAGFRPGHVRGVSPGPRGGGPGVAPAVRERHRGREAQPERRGRRRRRRRRTARRRPRRPPCREPSAVRRPPPAPAAPARRHPDQGPRRQARRQHGAEPHGAHRDDLPGGAGRRARGAAPRGSTRRSRRRASGQDLLHPPDRLRPGPGHQAAPRHGPHAGDARRRLPTGCSRKASRSAWRWTSSGRTGAADSSCR